MAKEKRKPGQRSRTGETKGEIIKYALEHGGIFEGAVLKDFLEENCNVRRETTKKHLDDLKKEGIFEKTGEKGYTNTWRIVEDTKAIVIIYKEYPHLLRYLQQSDFILDYVAKTESMLFEDEDGFEELKKMLRLSPKMFELCLTVDNLGGKFTSLSSKIDYYGAWDIVLKKGTDTEKKSLVLSEDLSEVLSVCENEEDTSEIGRPCEKEGNKKELATIKHHLRWELFRTALKTDVSFLDTGKITEEIDEMLTEERIRRSLAALLAVDFGKKIERTVEIMNNPEKHPEEIKELVEKARAMDESRLVNPEVFKKC